MREHGSIRDTIHTRVCRSRRSPNSRSQDKARRVARGWPRTGGACQRKPGPGSPSGPEAGSPSGQARASPRRHLNSPDMLTPPPLGHSPAPSHRQRDPDGVAGQVCACAARPRTRHGARGSGGAGGRCGWALRQLERTPKYFRAWARIVPESVREPGSTQRLLVLSIGRGWSSGVCQREVWRRSAAAAAEADSFRRAAHPCRCPFLRLPAGIESCARSRRTVIAAAAAAAAVGDGHRRAVRVAG